MRYELLGGQKMLVMDPGEVVPGVVEVYHQPMYGTFHRGGGLGAVTGPEVTTTGIVAVFAGLMLLYFLFRK